MIKEGTPTGTELQDGTAINNGDYIQMTLERTHGADKVLIHKIVFKDGAFCFENEKGKIWSPIYRPSYSTNLWNTFIKVDGFHYDL